jgi:hypothetical protein
MPLRWITVATAAALQAALAACSPSPEQFQPANPASGAGGFELHIGGCSDANSGAGCQNE